MYGFQQHNLTNQQYYDRFNTKVNVGEYIGITRQHRFLIEDTTQETLKIQFDKLSSDEQPEVRKDTEERYLSYIFPTRWKVIKYKDSIRNKNSV